MLTKKTVLFSALLALCSLALPGYSIPLEGDSERPLNIVALSLPLYGHFLPVKAIAEKLARRGHNVTVLTEKPHWCAGPVKLNCVQLPKTGAFPPNFFPDLSKGTATGETMVPVIEETVRYHGVSLPDFKQVFEEQLMNLPEGKGGRPDVLLADTSCYASMAIADKWRLPIANVFPLLIRFGLEPLSWVPLTGSEFSQFEMTLFQRWYTWIIGLILPPASSVTLAQVDSDRVSNGFRPFSGFHESVGLSTLTFAPTIWGYDQPHPQWPAVQPMGILTAELEEVPLEDPLETFLSSKYCKEHGAVYVNFGTLSAQTDRGMDQLYTGLVSELKMCVVWKIVEDQRREKAIVSVKKIKQVHRVYISKFFDSPIKIMGHSSTYVFVTHCGDTSLGEAITAEVPLVGIPFFADQGDVCQRLNERGLGIHAGNKHTFTAVSLARDIGIVAQNRSGKVSVEDEASKNLFLRNILQVKKMAQFLGGPDRAAEILEQQVRSKILVPPTANFGEEESYMLSYSKAVYLSPTSVYGRASIMINLGIFILFLLGSAWWIRRYGVGH